VGSNVKIAAGPGSAASSDRAAAIRRAGGPLRLVALLFGVWLLVPLAVLFVHVHGGLRISSGGRVFVGADFYDVPDQLQYMAWIRDAGQHALVSNLFDLRPDPHLFLHPLFAISGLLWQLGASIQLSFLAWQPIYAIALFIGFAAYAGRFIDSPAPRACALVLALFMFAPAGPLYDWLHIGDARQQFGTLVMGLEMFPAGYLTGAGAVAVGLMPLCLLGVERLLDPASGAVWRRRLGLAAPALAGALVAWLHPWQGVTLLVMFAGLIVWERRLDRSLLRLAPTVAATAAPLVYYFALGRTSSAWHDVSRSNNFPHFGAWFFAALVPLLIIAAPGLASRRRLDTGERLLRLWAPAALVVYVALHSTWIYHSFVALSLPLAIFAVRGWRRIGLRAPLAAAGIAALTIPGVVLYLQKLHREAPQHFLARSEASALRYLAAAPGGGGVLAREPLGTAVPAFSGRRTWVGHPTWTPQWAARAAAADALFAGRLSPSSAQTLVRTAGARFVLADCGARVDLRLLLGPLVASTKRFGCATLYTVAA
jgi:hypothetical protein